MLKGRVDKYFKDNNIVSSLSLLEGSVTRDLEISFAFASGSKDRLLDVLEILCILSGGQPRMVWDSESASPCHCPVH